MSKSGSGKPNSGYNSSNKGASVQCPTCGRDGFKSTHAMHIHHGHVHDESLVKTEKECPECGSVFECYEEQKYCSKECNIASQRSTVTKDCVCCGKSFDSRPSENQMYCSKKCFRSHFDFVSGEEHPQYTENVTLECDVCGSEYEEIPSRKDRSSYCSEECRTNKELPDDHPFQSRGEDHPGWRGGFDSKGYDGDWYKAREKALERDNYSCVICGSSKEDLTRMPHVHHIKPLSDFENKSNGHELNNLVTLCPTHHARWEGLYLRPDIR